MVGQSRKVIGEFLWLLFSFYWWKEKEPPTVVFGNREAVGGLSLKVFMNRLDRHLE